MNTSSNIAIYLYSKYIFRVLSSNTRSRYVYIQNNYKSLKVNIITLTLVLKTNNHKIIITNYLTIMQKQSKLDIRILPALSDIISNTIVLYNFDCLLFILWH
jgi:hypothetical protein